ncbi:bifunctional 5,10-methylene-tetrahydrofolate dehydrogenase/5,10-methylene-tetrahydrofolate cyclohydrolase [Halalkalibacillus sediminis]|uniref:Bifunctional protein FolD n=1 Tax=Halalkalibacillus sediminis TaxID=2018042 RepID=A0A2I0QQE5_9BACI|nr:tetrahydrofolate dehydrogenase/cyclohydrolase catalytic domain-containing protein [Halalkalibacillus sediminis]PKR76551.1 bifunctional 5,10-methylene-tetrahydrofolate dehydrogenase/5,10-methylene-tetrahydrofolate cyclohydrolase [Halalkalibacillus sediminis]
MNQPMILDGRKVATSIKEELKQTVESLSKQGVTPKLATILVGDNSSSKTYVQMKANACKKIGMESERIYLDEDTTTEELLDVITQLNEDDSVHGILLQHPVPAQIDERKAFDTIKLEKDVDGVTSHGFGSTAFQLNAYPCCTPAAIMKVIDFYDINVEGKHAIVIGRSPILGKPVSMMLLNRNATVTMSHSKTENLPELIKQADLVVAAVGKPNFVKGEWLKEGAVVLDAGYNEGNIGDVEYEACERQASAITPVPGGIGPVTIATLLQNTVEAASESLEKMNKINR